MGNNSVKIKICGLSRPEDIAYVNEAKPDFCGFIINVPKSIRNTTPDQVRRLRDRLSPEIIPVGVFRNEPAERVAALLNDGTIRVAQLHGNEDETYIRTLRALLAVPEGDPVVTLPRIRSAAGRCAHFHVLRTGRAAEAGRTDAAGECTAETGTGAFGAEAEIRIIQAFHEQSLAQAEKSSADLILLDHAGGGTGQTFSWSMAEPVRRPYFLAGGLGAENILDALNRLHPWGVDMSSGVETDGKKDQEKIQKVVEMVRMWKGDKE